MSKNAEPSPARVQEQLERINREVEKQLSELTKNVLAMESLLIMAKAVKAEAENQVGVAIPHFMAKDQYGATWQVNYREAGQSSPPIYIYTLQDGKSLSRLRDGVYETSDGSMRLASVHFK